MKKLVVKKMLITLISFFLFITSICATTQIELSLRELCEKSDNIILARVISTQSYLAKKEKRIFTNIELQVLEAFKGELKPFGNIALTVLGGTINGTTTFILGAPAFKVDEESILFLSDVTLPNNQKNYLVLGLSQGKFNVSLDPTSKIKKVKREQIETRLRLEKNYPPILLTNKEPILLKDFVDYIKKYL